LTEEGLSVMGFRTTFTENGASVFEEFASNIY
jgi:hypothetical protein